PLLMRLGATKEEQAVPLATRLPGIELATWPVNVAVPVLPQSNLGPFEGEDEELLGVDPSQPRGRKVMDEMAQGPGGRLAGIDPAPKRDDHRGQVGGRFVVEFYVIHDHPFGTRARSSG